MTECGDDADDGARLLILLGWWGPYAADGATAGSGDLC